MRSAVISGRGSSLMFTCDFDRETRAAHSCRARAKHGALCSTHFPTAPMRNLTKATWLASRGFLHPLPPGSSPARRDRYGRFSRCYRRRARHRESSAIPSTSHFHRQSSHPRICGNLIREGLQPASHVLDRAALWCLRRVWASARHYPSDRRSGFLSARMLSPVENLRADDP